MKALGVRVQFTDSLENGAQGKYEKGTVLIAKDAQDPLKQVYGHEITHRMQELAPHGICRSAGSCAGRAGQRAGISGPEPDPAVRPAQCDAEL
ncbi:MAG: hypothetical protein PUF46_04370 [Oscillospiraceae bacterium]|nr:hypothetical protein [Oscillospiraceae bacterium]